MPKSKKPKKPYPGFPLTAHPVGQWCKTINYKTYYFGPWADPKAAEAKYHAERDNIQAGRPRNTDTKPAADAPNAGPTVKRLCDSFLTEKFHAVQSKELAERTFVMYRRACEKLADKLGKTRQLSDLTTEDFQRLRAELSNCEPRDGETKKRGLVSLANEIRVVRIIVKYGIDTGMIEQQLRLNVAFKAPSKKSLRTEKNLKPARMLDADQLRLVLGAAARQQRAMILLGINCGFGQADVSALPESAVNLKAGWIDFPRPKTAVRRRCPLWPETIEALREAFAKRPQPTDERAIGKAFITRTGTLYVRSITKGEQIDDIVQVDGVALEFGKLLTKLKLKRPGLNFYCLRHGFETIAGESADQVAVSHIMGHAPASSDMAAVYRERISDERLQRVVDVVRKWLWPEGSEAAWMIAEAERAKAPAVK
jgi:integrase